MPKASASSHIQGAVREWYEVFLALRHLRDSDKLWHHPISPLAPYRYYSLLLVESHKVSSG